LSAAPPFSSSDHYSIVVSILLPTNSNSMEESISTPINLLPLYDWSRADWLSLANLVSNLDWSCLFDVIIVPNADWSMLYNSLVNFCNIRVPVFISSGSHSFKFDSIRKKVPRTIANLQKRN